MSAKLTITIPEWLDKICVSPLMIYRRLKYGEPFRKIYLGEDTYTIVDPDVYYEKCRFVWFLSDGSKAYPARTIKIGPEKNRMSYLHKEIVKSRKGMLIDHKDTDPFNNLRSNLRQATFSQNMMNRPKIKTKTTSKYRGVSWYKPRKRWRVAISYMQKGRTIIKHIGYFSDETEAAHAYDIAALKYHKDFANLNFPRDYYVKTRAGYKFAGESVSGKKVSLLGVFGKYLMMKGRC